MMNLYLVRHAEPKSREEDPERPLTEKGLADIKRVAEFIAEHVNIKVDRIIHSHKARARETAEVLADGLHPPLGISQEDGLDPRADVRIWTNKISISSEDLMLVGHIPYLSNLVSNLVIGNPAGELVEFKMGSMVYLSRNEDGIWTINWMITPEIITPGI